MRLSGPPKCDKIASFSTNLHYLGPRFVELDELEKLGAIEMQIANCKLRDVNVDEESG